MFMFLSSHGSSLVGLTFPPLGCLSVVFLYVTFAVSWLHRRMQRPNSWYACSILLPTMWLKIMCSLSSSIAVADGRVLVVCHFFVFVFFVLFAIFILHSRESELYRYTLDGKSALAWELPFSRFYGPPVFHIKAGASRLVPCPRTQQANLPACSPQPPINAERQAGKL